MVYLPEIWLLFLMVNVGEHTIHGSYGVGMLVFCRATGFKKGLRLKS